MRRILFGSGSVAVATAAVIAVGAVSAGSAAATTFTLADVAKHATASSCWSAIGGSVYDLTPWITKHPGGPVAITALCGKDGTRAFTGMHAGAAKPATVLAGYRIGTLAAAPKPSPSTTSTGTKVTLTRAVVARHRTATNCWSIVNGSVYNLTKWIGQHPGGPAVIKAMCGRDATAAFKGQHGLSGYEASKLATFRLGKLGATVTIPSTTPKPVTYTAPQIARHASAANCWVVVGSSVYNLTAWIAKHPGGAAVITAACGKDASRVFASVGAHGSASSVKMLAAFRVGGYSTAAGRLPAAVNVDDDGGDD